MMELHHPHYPFFFRFLANRINYAMNIDKINRIKKHSVYYSAYKKKTGKIIVKNGQSYDLIATTVLKMWSNEAQTKCFSDTRIMILPKRCLVFTCVFFAKFSFLPLKWIDLHWIKHHSNWNKFIQLCLKIIYFLKMVAFYW